MPPGHTRQAEMLLKRCDQCKLAILNNGMLVLVPVYTELYDVVYVLLGASVPFILPKQKDKSRACHGRRVLCARHHVR
jgi:hypothetical protein